MVPMPGTYRCTFAFLSYRPRRIVPGIDDEKSVFEYKMIRKSTMYIYASDTNNQTPCSISIVYKLTTAVL